MRKLNKKKDVLNIKNDIMNKVDFEKESKVRDCFIEITLKVINRIYSFEEKI